MTNEELKKTLIALAEATSRNGIMQGSVASILFATAGHMALGELFVSQLAHKVAEHSKQVLTTIDEIKATQN